MTRWTKKELIEDALYAVEMMIEKAMKKVPKDAEGLRIDGLINWGDRELGGKPKSSLGTKFYPVGFIVENPKNPKERRRRINEYMKKEANGSKP